jgi:hypothetical protein
MFAPPGLSLRALIPHTGPVTERLRVREIDDDEGQRLVRIIRCGSGSVVTWRRAYMLKTILTGLPGGDRRPVPAGPGPEDRPLAGLSDDLAPR